MIRTLVSLAALALLVLPLAAEEITFGALKSNTPASWKPGETNKLRVHSFVIPKAKGDDADGELAIFFFGAGQGGGIAENLKRWKSMFEAPEGKSIDDVSKVDAFKVGPAEVTYLDVKGTYLSKFPPFAPNAKITRKPDYRMIAVVFECEGGPYFMRLTGPAATVAAAKSDFDSWLKNFK